jgi:membrane-bound serine protease (ClpP class)
METLGYLLVVVGLILMAAELLLPTGGIEFVLGIGAIITGVAMIFSYDATQGLVVLIALFIILPTAGPLILHYWPRTPLGRRFVLNQPTDDAAIANMPVNLELEALRGRYGRTLSALRPSGVTDFDGQRVDTLSEGAFIEAGSWVRCIDVRSGRVVVRAVEAPPDLNALNPEDFKV